MPRIMCFGSSSSNKEDPDAKRSREIEKQLREDGKRMQREIKLLLLGIHIDVRTRQRRRMLTSAQELESLGNQRCSSRCV